LDEAAMLNIAASLGYSETAFVTARGDTGVYDVRYFSPVAEVPFCGHATVAAAVALAERGAPGHLRFETQAGLVEVAVRTVDVPPTATLTSVVPDVDDVDVALLEAALAALHWGPADLDPSLPPSVAYAGARHLILAASTRERLADLDYDFEALRDLMLKAEWTTVALIWRESEDVFHARNPFPVGGVVEDPATGAAAAALGAYLRSLGTAPPRFTIQQGEDMGRPSRLMVDVESARPRVRVSGQAVRMPEPSNTDHP
jgi:PhzF family phenazine biosynthesis protein